MSIHIMNAVWQHGPQDTSARMLLLAIADCANDQGEAFPSVALLGQKSCMSKSTVLRTLQGLETAGWFAVRRRTVQWDGDTHPRGNLYVVALERLRLQAPKQAEVRTPRGVMVTPHNADREVSKAASRSVRMTPHVAPCEVSKTALRGVKSERPPTPPLVGEPSGTVTTPPNPLTEGELDPLDALWEEAQRLEAQLKPMHQRRQTVEWFMQDIETRRAQQMEAGEISKALIAVRYRMGQIREARKPAPVETGVDPPLTPGRRRRRLTQVQLLARVGGG
jgi:hypothetical protein